MAEVLFENCGVNRDLWETVLKAMKIGVIILNGNNIWIGNESFSLNTISSEDSDNPYTLAFKVAAMIEKFNEHDFMECVKFLKPVLAI